MKQFQDLLVWQKAHDLTLTVYQVTSEFPKDEIYGLTRHLRSSSASIPSNIAEGYGRYSNNELARSFQISIGSAYELEYHLILARDLNLLNEISYTSLKNSVNEIQRMLISFTTNIRKNIHS